MPLAKQLDDFALNLSRGEQAQTDVLWEQQPAQQLIQQGYQLAFNWHGGAEMTPDQLQQPFPGVSKGVHVWCLWREEKRVAVLSYTHFGIGD